MQPLPQALSCIILGSTGAVGYQLVPLLLQSPNWGKVVVMARRQLEEWKNLQGKEKLKFIKVDDLGDMAKEEKWTEWGLKDNKIDCTICLLGSRVGRGQQEFTRVDKTYPLLAATMSSRLNIPHYIHCSSTGSNANSFFMYPRVKGEVERDLRERGLNFLSIIKPGALLNRKEGRFGEKCLAYLPFFPKIQTRNTARAVQVLAEKFRAISYEARGEARVYENDDLLALLTP